MSILVWEKPPKARPTAEHNDMHQSDTNIAGTYAPNMPEEWKRKWKAKQIGGTDPRIEIRVTAGDAATQVLIVVRQFEVKMSMNGAINVTPNWFDALFEAVVEAWNILAGKQRVP